MKKSKNYSKFCFFFFVITFNSVIMILKNYPEFFNVLIQFFKPGYTKFNGTVVVVDPTVDFFGLFEPKGHSGEDDSYKDQLKSFMERAVKEHEKEPGQKTCKSIFRNTSG